MRTDRAETIFQNGVLWTGIDGPRGRDRAGGRRRTHCGARRSRRRAAAARRRTRAWWIWPGRRLIPGFVDAHAHIWKIGHLLTTLLDVRGATSLARRGDAAARACRTVSAGHLAAGTRLQRGALRRRSRAHARRPRRRRERSPRRPDAHLRAHRRLQQPGAGARGHRARHRGAARRRDRSRPGRRTDRRASRDGDGPGAAAIPPPTHDEYAAMIDRRAAASGCRSASRARTTRAWRPRCSTPTGGSTARAGCRPGQRDGAAPGRRRRRRAAARSPAPFGSAADRHGEVLRRWRPERRDRRAQRAVSTRRHARRPARSSTTNCWRSRARRTTPAGASPRTRSATRRSIRCSASTRRAAEARSATASSTSACPPPITWRARRGPA